MISLALESVDYDENKAEQILQIMMKEEEEEDVKAKDVPTDKVKEENIAANNLTISTSQSKQSLKSLLKSDISRDKSNLSR